MKELPLLSDTPEKLLLLSRAENTEKTLPGALKLIEEIAESVSSELRRQGLSHANGNTLHAHAYSVMENGKRRNF